MNEKVAARAKKSAARASATGARGRKPTKRDEVSREFAQTRPAHIQRKSKKAIRANETWIARSRAP